MKLKNAHNITHPEPFASQVPIKRGTSGIDDLFGYTASDVENESRIEVVGNDNFEELIQIFSEYLVETPYYLKELDPFILNPFEINDFIQFTAPFTESDSYPRLLGIVSQKLIVNSYKEGYNNFKLDFRNLVAPSFFASDLKGKDKNPIQIEVKGDVSGNSFQYVKNAHIKVNGNVGTEFARHTENSTAYPKFDSLLTISF
jgi:hypothetical protein